MISFAEANALLRYEPETGKLFWRVDRTAGVKAGDEVGCRNQGYLKVRILGHRYLAHRVAWLLHFGAWPPTGFDIDHVNRDTFDNRMINLRLATRSQNSANAGHQRNNTSGFKGVSWHCRKKKYQANICVGFKQKYLGSFDTAEAAHNAYATAALHHFKEFARSA